MTREVEVYNLAMIWGVSQNPQSIFSLQFLHVVRAFSDLLREEDFLV